MDLELEYSRTIFLLKQLVRNFVINNFEAFYITYIFVILILATANGVIIRIV